MEYSKEELVSLIELYQNSSKEVETRPRKRTEVAKTLNYTSPRIEALDNKRRVGEEYKIEISKTLYSQKANDSQFKMPNESEKEMIKYKQVVNVLLSAAADEQRDDLITEVQIILTDSSLNML